MRVYRIEYHEYVWQFSGACDRNDWLLTPVRVKYVIADNSLDAVDLLRADHRGRIEIACIEHVCKVDIKKEVVGQFQNIHGLIEPREIRPTSLIRRTIVHAEANPASNITPRSAITPGHNHARRRSGPPSSM